MYHASHHTVVLVSMFWDSLVAIWLHLSSQEVLNIRVEIQCI